MNNKNYALIERIGQALHTKNHWKKPLEEQLGVQYGCIDKWRKSEEKWPNFEIKRGVWVDLLSLLEQHQNEAQSLIKEVDDLLKELE